MSLLQVIIIFFNIIIIIIIFHHFLQGENNNQLLLHHLFLSVKFALCWYSGTLPIFTMITTNMCIVPNPLELKTFW